MRLNNLTGQKLGRWRVLSRAEGPFRGTWWNCVCDCGTEQVRNSIHLKAGKSHLGCSFNYSEESILRSVVASYKGAAEKRGLKWALTEQQALALFAGDCAYCKAPPGNERRSKGRTALYNGIDRVENARGYDPDNVVSCCGPCNIAKGTRTAKQFLAWAHQIARNNPEPPFDLSDLSARDRSRHAVIDDVLDLYDDE